MLIDYFEIVRHTVVAVCVSLLCNRAQRVTPVRPLNPHPGPATPCPRTFRCRIRRDRLWYCCLWEIWPLEHYWDLTLRSMLRVLLCRIAVEWVLLPSSMFPRFRWWWWQQQRAFLYICDACWSFLPLSRHC